MLILTLLGVGGAVPLNNIIIATNAIASFLNQVIYFMKTS